MDLALQTQGIINYWVGAIKLLRSYFRRHNPWQELVIAFITTLKNGLTMNKKLKIAKYRVYNLQAQMNKMDKMINENNPYNFLSGGKLNTFN